MTKRSKNLISLAFVIVSLLFASAFPAAASAPLAAAKAPPSVQISTVEGAFASTPTPSLASAETPHPILSDIRVRRALAYCTDRTGLIASVYGYLNASQQQSLLMDTFLPKAHWFYQSPTITYTYPFSPTVGGQLLDQAGWTLEPSATYRTNADGYQLALKFTTTTAQFRQTWATVLENQLRDNCGIHLLRFHIPASVWFGGTSGLARRDFELGAFAWVATTAPPGPGLYGCDYIPTPDNGWQGLNYMGWCNSTASNALTQGSSSLLRQERLDQYAIAQEEFAKDMVSLPLFNRLSLYVTAPNLTGFAPDPSEYLYTWNVYSWTVPAINTIRIGMAQEPGTLFPLVDSSFATGLAASLIYGRGFTSLNYDYQARMYQSLPTIENGGAVTRTLSVSAGTTVVDANGNVGPLAVGMRVIDASGQVVTYTSGALNMTQLVITGTFLSGLKWSDGSSLLQADLQLWDTINCDPASGAFNLYQCDRTANREYLSATAARYTLVPGYLPWDYSTFLPGAYPSERILSDSRKLKDVPASGWSTLPEIAEFPIGLGPYRITSWEKGVRMIFERNPYFALGMPQTQYLEIRFIPDTGTAINELIAGNIHVLGSETTSGYEQTLFDAAALNQVKVYPIATATWEHMDMNLGLYTQAVVKSLPPAGGVVTSTLGIQAVFPTGALTDTATTITFNSLLVPTQSLVNAVSTFTLEAVNSLGQPVTQFQQPITIIVDYTDTELATLGLDESALSIALWNGSAWVDAATTCTPASTYVRDPVQNRLSVAICHLSEFALFGPARVYLPLVMK